MLQLKPRSHWKRIEKCFKKRLLSSYGTKSQALHFSFESDLLWHQASEPRFMQSSVKQTYILKCMMSCHIEVVSSIPALHVSAPTISSCLHWDQSWLLSSAVREGGYHLLNTVLMDDFSSLGLVIVK